MFIVWFLPAVIFAQQTARGTVYLDSNGNGQRDPGEKGIPEVPVSNGRDVELTDESGQYALSIDEDGGTIFVIKPAGYKLPVNHHNLPQFYYIHKPEGSPDLNHEGVDQTGPLPDSINFALQEGEKENSFRALLFGDPQPRNKKEIGYFKKDIVEGLRNSEKYKFGITLGDIVYNKLGLFDYHNQTVAEIGLPWYNVIGNHDLNFDAEMDKHSDETFEATYGPPTFSFNYGNAHFILLDDVIYPSEEGVRNYIGGFTDKQLEFIKNDLEHVPTDHLVVIAFHIPLHLEEGYFREKDRRRLLDMLEDYPHNLSLSAHRHQQEFHFLDSKYGWEGAKPHIHYVVGTSGGDWWSGEPDKRGVPRTLMRDGTPNGYAVLNVENDQFTFDYKAANYPKDFKMRIWGPDDKMPSPYAGDGNQLFVNYFLGTDSTRVEYRINGRSSKWMTMQQVYKKDPFVLLHRNMWSEYGRLLKGRRPSNPIRSPHLWHTDLPDHLSAGKHTIEIRVTDMYDRSYRKNYTFTVEKK